MAAVGQIWEYRKSPNYNWKVPDEHLGTRRAIYHTKMAWRIEGGEFRGTELWWVAEVIRDEDGWLDADAHEFRDEVFESGDRFRLIYDPAADEGVYCGKCGRFFPYASWKSDFACWGCRNGY